jgi:hypothetical protein
MSTVFNPKFDRLHKLSCLGEISLFCVYFALLGAVGGIQLENEHKFLIYVEITLVVKNNYW